MLFISLLFKFRRKGNKKHRLCKIMDNNFTKVIIYYNILTMNVKKAYK